MSVIASETDDAKPGVAIPGALRDLTGAYAVVGSRWGEALSAGRELVGLLASHPLARAESRLAVEMARIALGRSTVRPAADDRRFSHDTWMTNPVFKRVLQGYIAWSDALMQLVHGLRVAPEHRRRLLFAAEHLVAAAAPSNLFLTHPGFYDNAVSVSI